LEPGLSEQVISASAWTDGAATFRLPILNLTTHRYGRKSPITECRGADRSTTGSGGARLATLTGGGNRSAIIFNASVWSPQIARISARKSGRRRRHLVFDRRTNVAITRPIDGRTFCFAENPRLSGRQTTIFTATEPDRHARRNSIPVEGIGACSVHPSHHPGLAGVRPALGAK
jgi:hypothetical protein